MIMTDTQDTPTCLGSTRHLRGSMTVKTHSSGQWLIHVFSATYSAGIQRKSGRPDNLCLSACGRWSWPFFHEMNCSSNLEHPNSCFKTRPGATTITFCKPGQDFTFPSSQAKRQAKLLTSVTPRQVSDKRSPSQLPDDGSPYQVFWHPTSLGGVHSSPLCRVEPDKVPLCSSLRFPES